MNYLDSAYASAVNPSTVGKLDPQQLQGLGSLFPQNQGLMSPTPTALNPTFPAPTINGSDAKDFAWEPGRAEELFTQGTPFGVGSPLANLQIPNLSPNSQPYFDPNYPFESMMAEKNFMNLNLPTQVSQGQNARGLAYSGLGPGMQSKAQGELNQMTLPGETPKDAVALDMERLYGPNIANSLESGWGAQMPSGSALPIPGALSGATPFPGGTNAQAALLSNPDLGLGGLQPKTGNMLPSYGLVDYASGNSYATPGYLYNPTAPPDYSRMPWLSATPTSQTSGVA